MSANDSSQSSEDRLFVPLKTEHYRGFESGAKDIELRGVNGQFNPDTVRLGRRVELRRGYSTDDSIYGYVRQRRLFDDLSNIADVVDHTRILPDSTREEFETSVSELLGDYSRFIAFEVECTAPYQSAGGGR